MNILTKNTIEPIPMRHNILVARKISVDDKYRAYNAVKLIRNELIKDISIYDKIFIDSWCSIDKPISGKEKRIITDPLKFVINNGTITWNENFDERLNPTTDLYVIATMKAVKETDKNDIIDAVLDEINDIDLGEYKNILLKKAVFHTNLTIDDYEKHPDEVIVSMADYLTGAAEAIKILKNNPS